MLRFEPQTQGEVEFEDARRVRERAQTLADKSYPAREAQHFDGIKKLAQKFNRATVLVLKHTDALTCINSSTLTRSTASTPKPSTAGFVSTSANDGGHTHRLSSLRSNRISPACGETTQDGASTCRTSITSWDHLSKPCNAMRMMRLSKRAPGEDVRIVM